MNESPKAPTATRKLIHLRRGFLVGCLAAALYLGSFVIDTYSGGYWSEVERDGRDRYSFGLSMPTAVLWQPRFGYWAPYRSDWLGTFYSPLIRLDRRFLHPSRYVSDPAFFAWAEASKISDWHPRFHGEYLASHTKHQ